jgi:cation-transporting ATPase 13A1
LFQAIFCTEPFRIPSAGRVDVCCFDKTGTITTEHLVLEGVAGVNAADSKSLVKVTEAGARTTMCLAAAHALVKLDDGTVVGDPMEKTTLEALNWQIGKGDAVVPAEARGAPAASVRIRRRFQFSSALKRMSTIASTPDNRSLAAVKGAPETIKQMLATVPEGYDDTYKWFTRRGSRVLALGIKDMGSLSTDAVCVVRQGAAHGCSRLLTVTLDQQDIPRAGGKCPDVRWLPRLPLPPQAGRDREPEDAR